MGKAGKSPYAATKMLNWNKQKSGYMWCPSDALIHIIF